MESVIFVICLLYSFFYFLIQYVYIFCRPGRSQGLLYKQHRQFNRMSTKVTHCPTQLYGSAKPKRLGMVPPVINKTKDHRFRAF